MEKTAAGYYRGSNPLWVCRSKFGFHTLLEGIFDGEPRIEKYKCAVEENDECDCMESVGSADRVSEARERGTHVLNGGARHRINRHREHGARDSHSERQRTALDQRAEYREHGSTGARDSQTERHRRASDQRTGVSEVRERGTHKLNGTAEVGSAGQSIGSTGARNSRPERRRTASDQPTSGARERGTHSLNGGARHRISRYREHGARDSRPERQRTASDQQAEHGEHEARYSRPERQYTVSDQQAEHGEHGARTHILNGSVGVGSAGRASESTEQGTHNPERQRRASGQGVGSAGRASGARSEGLTI
ncbi:hypothetical protein B0H13DRAFT_1887952 [Mycena leptocephala]|nr:hypothetical protein B0H13DRAFT_1887952 [Mycena leptocephala]